MYEMFLPTQFDLATSNKLLQYEIDTFGGNSGSPVIVKENLKAIGVHVLGGSTNSASVIGPLGNVFQLYKDSFVAKPDPAFNIATKVPSRVKSFRVVSIPAWDKTNSSAADTESLFDSPTSVFDGLHSLLDSSVHAPDNSEVLLGKLQALLEPSMVSAMSDACNGAEGLVKALRFLWDSSEDSQSNTEALLTTIARHKSTAKKVGSAVIKHKGTVLKVGEKIAEVTPPGRILKYGMDAADIIADSNNESLMDHIATGLSVTVPLVHKELPKLGSIGGPIATMAASALRSVGAQAAAAVNSNSEPSSPAPESAPIDPTPLPGAKDRAILAEMALHGIMRLDKEVLKQHQVFDKMHTIIKPLAPTIQRADSMLSSIMQPSITKVAVASVNNAITSTDASQGAADAIQQTTSAPQSPTAPETPAAQTESAYYKNASGFRPKIGVTVTSPSTNSSKDDASPTQATTQDSTPVDGPVYPLTEALLAANPGLEDTLAGIVERGTQVDNDAFSNATMFGLPILLGNGQESEYQEQKDECAVAVTGLAQRAMLAEAALQVVLQLPSEIVRSLEIPNIGPILDAFGTEEGLDESSQSGQAPVPPPISSGAAWTAAGASVVSSLASSAGALVTHKDKLKDQEQKEQELALKRKDQEQKDRDHEIAKIGQNLDAHSKGLEPPHPDVKHWDAKTGKVIEPGADEHDGGGGGPGGHRGGGTAGGTRGGRGGAAPGVGAPPRGGGGGGGPPRGGAAVRGGGQHAGTVQQHHTGSSEEPEQPSSSSNPLGMSATARGKRPVPAVKPKPSNLPTRTKPTAGQHEPAEHPGPTEEHHDPSKPKPPVPPHKPTIEQHEPEHPKPEEGHHDPAKPNPTVPPHHPTAEHHEPEQHPKPEEEHHDPTKPKPPVPPHHPTTQQPAPAHSGGFAKPTASSAAKQTKPPAPKPKPKPPVAAKKGKREALLEEDPESLLAEDFVSGFADI